MRIRWTWRDTMFLLLAVGIIYLIAILTDSVNAPTNFGGWWHPAYG